MALMDFNIDTSGSPQDVQRKQALADALMKQGMDSSPAAGGKGGGWVTALNRGLAGALGGYQRGAAANEEQQGRDSVRQQLAAALSGNGGKIDQQTMIGLASNPWATPGQTQAVTHVADMQAQQARQAVEDQHWKASFGLQQQAAARAADKTPAGFMADPANPGGYKPIPGGPADPAYLQNATKAKNDADLLEVVNQRKQVADSIGMKPDNPGYNSYIATGKMPREDAQPLTATDKKAIIDAEEKLQSSKATIANLQQAKTLSPKAMQGPGASTRGYFSSFLGDSSDLGKAGIATQDLENLVTTNALQSLKSIFGGNPTEGERAILLDVQGSVGKPDAVRQKIFDRAIEAANRRMAFEQQHIDQLRGGTFYKPQGGLSGTSQGAPQQEAPAAAAPDPLGIR